MTAGPLDTYLEELARALRERGHAASRIVEEAREHLADAVEDGLRRGLAREDAEREAVERFGPADVIAAQTPPVRNHMMARVTVALDTVVGHWRWVTAATAAAALLTSLASSYWLPTRYRSESVILVQPQEVPAELAAAATAQSRARMQLISQTILSRPRLEWIAKDFGLDKRQEPNAPMDDTVQQMRRSISVEVLPPQQPESSTDAGVLKVSFESPDPRLSMRVTERIAAMFVEENLRQRAGVLDGTNQALEAAIEDVRFRLAEQESKLVELRAQRRPLSRADELLFEVLQDRYRDLLVKREDSRSTSNLARRAVGDQFRVLEAARLPKDPVGPSRTAVNAGGAFAGLALSIGALIFRQPAR